MVVNRRRWINIVPINNFQFITILYEPRLYEPTWCSSAYIWRRIIIIIQYIYLYIYTNTIYMLNWNDYTFKWHVMYKRYSALKTINVFNLNFKVTFSRELFIFAQSYIHLGTRHYYKYSPQSYYTSGRNIIFFYCT